MTSDDNLNERVAAAIGWTRQLMGTRWGWGKQVPQANGQTCGAWLSRLPDFRNDVRNVPEMLAWLHTQPSGAFDSTVRITHRVGEVFADRLKHSGRGRSLSEAVARLVAAVHESTRGDAPQQRESE